jgi:hypothetical protein
VRGTTVPDGKVLSNGFTNALVGRQL